MSAIVSVCRFFPLGRVDGRLLRLDGRCALWTRRHGRGRALGMGGKEREDLARDKALTVSRNGKEGEQKVADATKNASDGQWSDAVLSVVPTGLYWIWVCVERFWLLGCSVSQKFGWVLASLNRDWYSSAFWDFTR